MRALELKVLPPVVALTILLAMWVISLFTPSAEIGLLFRALAGATIALLGVGISFSGVAAFRRAETTVNPMKPGDASSLVTNGVFRFTRNPMYLGMLLVIIGWAVFLSAPWVFAGPLAFVAYLTRFQITPEERVLASIFGEPYRSYISQVRRWL